jgi:hypothetical protein
MGQTATKRHVRFDPPTPDIHFAERFLRMYNAKRMKVRDICSAWLVRPKRVTPQSDVELVTEKQVFNFKLASRLEHVGDEHCERVQDH